eukprot:jgi/Mesvir1/3929/Mv19868-RA.1
MASSVQGVLAGHGLRPDFFYHRTGALIDYVFALKENIIMNLEKLYKNFFGIVPTFEVFCHILNECTQNYECLVIDHTSGSNKLEDVIFWYKGEMRPPFKVGSSKFWKYGHARHDPNKHDSDSDDDRKRVSTRVVKHDN